jgi:hypothetical protein
VAGITLSRGPSGCPVPVRLGKTVPLVQAEYTSALTHLQVQVWVILPVLIAGGSRFKWEGRRHGVTRGSN